VGDAEGILYVIPIVMLAIRFGLRGGAAGALVSFALIAIWDLHYHPATVTPVGYLSRGVSFAILGVLLGVFVDRSRNPAADDPRAQHEGESQFADTGGGRAARRGGGGGGRRAGRRVGPRRRAAAGRQGGGGGGLFTSGKKPKTPQ